MKPTMNEVEKVYLDDTVRELVDREGEKAVSLAEYLSLRMRVNGIGVSGQEAREVICEELKRRELYPVLNRPGIGEAT